MPRAGPWIPAPAHVPPPESQRVQSGCQPPPAPHTVGAPGGYGARSLHCPLPHPGYWSISQLIIQMSLGPNTEQRPVNTSPSLALAEVMVAFSQENLEGAVWELGAPQPALCCWLGSGN